MKFERLLFIFALIWYSLTAYYSIGYFHPDEHYQIIEFAGLLNDSNTPNDLSWEYKAQIRPSAQPIICYFILEICEQFGVTNPYDKSFILRLIIGQISVFVILFFTNSCKEFVLPTYWKPFLILSYFIWFLPFLNVRFSSETFSGMTLLAAIGFSIRTKVNNKNRIIVGALLGLSFLFRFQTAIFSLGLLLWLYFIKKETILKLSLLSLSSLFIVAFGSLLDFWFYDELVLTFWNYLNANIFEGKAAEFGVSPWYYYLVYSVLFSFLPIGLSIISAFIILLFKKPNSIFVWTILPFILVHSFIGHKELRFLFPVINFIPIVLILSLQELKLESCSKGIRKLTTFFLLLLFISNLTGILLASFIPPSASGNSRVKLTKKIHEITSNQPTTFTLIYADKSNPFNPWGLTTNFYNQQNIRFEKIEFTESSAIIPYNNKNNNLLVLTIGDLQNPDIQYFIKHNDFREICKGVPNYILPILKTLNRAQKVLVLYSNSE